MPSEFKRKGKVIYGLMLFAVAIYLITTESINFRYTTVDGLELNVLAAAFVVAAINLILEVAFKYDSNDPSHPYRTYNLILLTITITLIVVVFVFAFFEDEILNLAGIPNPCHIHA